MSTVCLQVQEIEETNLFDLKGKNLFRDANHGNFAHSLSELGTNQQTPLSSFSEFDLLINETISNPLQKQYYRIPKNCTDNLLKATITEGSANFLAFGTSTINFEANKTYYIYSYVYIPTIFEDLLTAPYANIYLEVFGFTPANVEYESIWSYVENSGCRWQFLCTKIEIGPSDETGQIGAIHLDSQTLVGGGTPLLENIPVYFDYLALTCDSKLEKSYQYKATNCYDFTLASSLDATVSKKLRDIQKPQLLFQTDSSKTLTICQTKESIKAIGTPENLQSVRSHYRFCRNWNASLTIDGCEILNGIIKFGNTVQQNGKVTYPATLLGATKRWSDQLEGLCLNDFSWNKYNHQRSKELIEETWTLNGDTGLFVYPLYLDTPQYVPSDTDPINFHAPEMQHWLFLKPMLQHVFEQIGWCLTFKGDFLESEDFRDLIVMMNYYHIPFPQNNYSAAISPSANFSSSIDMKESLCPYKVKDILKCLAGMFNLVSITNEGTREVCLITMNDYIHNKKIHLNPEKLIRDCSQPRETVKLSSLFSKICFEYCKDDEDVWFAKGQNNPFDSSIAFGDECVNLDPSAQSEQKIELAFAATRRYLVDGSTDFYIPRAEADYSPTDEDEGYTQADLIAHPKFKPRILKWNGMQPTDGTFTITDVGNAPQTYSGEYPQAEFYSEIQGGMNLAFHDYGNESVLNEGLANKHWKNEIEAYQNSSLITGYYFLSLSQIKNMNADTICEEEGVLVLKNQLVDFDFLNPKKSAKLELINYKPYYPDFGKD